jgi:probable phosphoglycerate mutase
MQLLLIRHALPLRTEAGQGSDPDLSEDGIEQAKRLPDALARFPITRLVSSPQRRALQTANRWPTRSG